MARNKSKGKGKGSSGQNRSQTEEFFKKNRQKAGVVQTPTGLQFKILENGEGPQVPEGAMVTMHHRIHLIDGTQIEDTYKLNQPETFSLTEAIEGLKEGIPLMCAGARYVFYIPPELAWGKRGAGEKIGPNATLISDIKLLEFY